MFEAALPVILVAIIGLVVVCCVLPLTWNGRASDAPEGRGKWDIASKACVDRKLDVFETGRRGDDDVDVE